MVIVIVTVLLQLSPDSDSEISLKINQNLTKLKRTKVCQFWGHPVGTIVLACSFKQL